MTSTNSTTRLDHAWVAVLTCAGTILSSILASNLFDLSVFLSGIVCVALIAIGRREGYIVGLYNCIAYSNLAYRNGLFGEVALNLLFFVPTGIAGYLMWKRQLTNTRTVHMRELAGTQRGILFVVCIAGTAALDQLLRFIPGQNTPLLDATTNVLSIVATFLMMWRFKEQWVLYIVLNVVSIGMWLLRTLAGGESGDLMVLMWILYLLNALFGLWRWNLGTREARAGSTGHGDVSCGAV